MQTAVKREAPLSDTIRRLKLDANIFDDASLVEQVDAPNQSIDFTADYCDVLRRQLDAPVDQSETDFLEHHAERIEARSNLSIGFRDAMTLADRGVELIGQAQAAIGERVGDAEREIDKARKAADGLLRKLGCDDTETGLGLMITPRRTKPRSVAERQFQHAIASSPIVMDACDKRDAVKHQGDLLGTFRKAIEATRGKIADAHRELLETAG